LLALGAAETKLIEITLARAKAPQIDFVDICYS